MWFKFGGERSNMPRRCLAFLILSLFLFFAVKAFVQNILFARKAQQTSPQWSLPWPSNKCFYPSSLPSAFYIFTVSIMVELCICLLVYCCLHLGRAWLLMSGPCTLLGLLQAFPQIFLTEWMNLESDVPWLHCDLLSLPCYCWCHSLYMEPFSSFFKKPRLCILMPIILPTS